MAEKEMTYVFGLAQCPYCEHMRPIYHTKTRGLFLQCNRCEIKKYEKQGDLEKEVGVAPRMKVQWLETAMPYSLYMQYFQHSQLK